MADADLPVLHQLRFSHYNEKVRWALDLKEVPHVRRALVPGLSRKVARRLTGSPTTPVLELDGRAIGDSTAIIAALEETHPDTPLYPEDPDERRAALELEDHFDETIGISTRRLMLDAALQDPDVFLGTFLASAPEGMDTAVRENFSSFAEQTRAQFDLTDATLDEARGWVRDGGEVLARERGADGYLVGDALTVADVTLAALVAPILAPAELPYRHPFGGHPLVQPVIGLIEEAGLAGWTRDLYARHRPPSAAVEDHPPAVS